MERSVSVLEAGDVVEALVLIQARRGGIDLLITGSRMPRMGGIESM